MKVYRSKYLRKGNYVCRSYYLYLPKEVAEPLVGKELRIVRKLGGILIEPNVLDTNIAREHLPSRAGVFPKPFSTVERVLGPSNATHSSTRIRQ